MIRKPLLIFTGLTGMLVAGALLFIRSETFAGALRRSALAYLPRGSQVDVDFSRVSIGFFPPSVGFSGIRFQANEGNFLDLSAGTRIVADSLELSFGAVQMLSGNIRVRKVSVSRGELDLPIRPKASRSSQKGQRGSERLQWSDLFQVQVESVSLEDSRVRLSAPSVPEFQAQALAERAEISRSRTSQGELAYQLQLGLRDLQAQLPKAWNVPFQGIHSFEADLKAGKSGVEIARLEAKSPGLRIGVSGRVDGDLLDPKKLPMDLQGELKFDLSALRSWIPELEKRAISGQSSFRGRLQGDFARLQETLRGEGRLELQKLKAGTFEADRAELNGSWASSDGGELQLQGAEIEAVQAPRVGGVSPGKGGKLRIGNVRYRLRSNEPVTVPVELEGAHIHWLGAAAVESIWNLDLRLNGKIQATYHPASRKNPGHLLADLDLKAKDFHLDNQRPGMNRPRRDFLALPEVALKGPVLIDSKAVAPQGLQVSAGRIQLTTDGKIDYATGWDLQAEGPVALQDLGQLAQNPIRGEGKMKLQVRGRPERVKLDFDCDLKDAYYLDMAFGDFQGRVTYDDAPTHLIFSGIRAEKGRTRYEVDGRLEMGDREKADISARFLQGRIEDLTSIFADMLKPVSWFPRTLNGDFRGGLTVGGGLDLKTLRVQGELAGTHWEWMGERFAQARLVGGYDRGRYFIEEFRGTKNSGRLRGRISYGPEPMFDWSLITDDFHARDFDHVSRLDVPVKASFRATSQGRGKEGEVESLTILTVSDLNVRGTSYPDSSLEIRTRNGQLQAIGQAFGGQASVDGLWGSAAGAAGRLKLKAQELDFSPVLLLLNPRLIQDPMLRGRLSGSADLSLPSERTDLASGTVSIDAYELRKTGTSFTLAKPARLELHQGTAAPTQVVVRGTQGDAVLKLASRDGALDGSIQGRLDASLIEFLTSSIQQASGAQDLDFRILGRWSLPTIEGRIRLSDVVLRVGAVESPFENIRGELSLRQGLVRILDLSGDLAGGRVTSTGQVELFADRYPDISLQSNVQGSRIKVFPFQFAKLRGKLGVRGNAPPYLVDGSMVVESALSREKVLNTSQGRVLKSALYTPPPGSSREADIPLFKLDIGVRADQGVIVKNDLFDAELKAQIKVVNTLEAPRIVGTADVLRGNLSFKDRIFQIQSAQIQFDNPAVLNPAFNMTSSSDINGTKVQLYAVGRMDAWKIDLSSNPVLPESEIISLLALGATSEEVRRLRGGDRSSFEQGEAASLLLHSLDFNRNVKDKTGFQIQLDEAVGTVQGASVFRPRADMDSTTSPKLVIRRRIGKKVDLSVGSTVGVGTNHQREVNLEYQLTPGVSVNGVWDTQETLETQEPQTSYGVDLKLQRRFK